MTTGFVPATDDPLAITPAGAGLRWLLAALADPSALTPDAVAARCSPALAPDAADVSARLAGVAAELGPVTAERVSSGTPYDAAARLVAADGSGWALRCVVEEDPPHRIALIQLSPARLPTASGCGSPVPWADIANPAAVGGPVGGGLDEPLSGELAAALASTRADLGLPCLLGGVVLDGQLAWWGGAGYAEVATRRRPTRRTALRLGSVSTVLVAAAAHRLAAAGRLGLDDPVGDHLPAPRLVAPDGSVVRVRHLLEHTAGVPADPGVPLAGPVGQQPPDLATLVGEVVRTAWPAGERFGHSALGYAVLGEVLARAAGRSFDEELTAAVLDPAGMRRTSFRLDDRVARQPLCGYDVDFGEVLLAPATDPVLRAAAGAVSTLEDLARLAALLGQPASRPLVEPSAPTGVDGVAVTRGGLLVADLGPYPVAWHCGGWPGSVAGVWVAPRHGAGLVLAGNGFSPALLARLDGVGRELLLTVLDRLDR